MCTTNTYVDRYPNGHTVTYRRITICEYGKPGRPCTLHSNIEEPVRNLNWGDLTTEHMLTRPHIYQPQHRHPTPPRSPQTSQHRHSSSSGSPRRAKRTHSPLRPTRQHRKERIVIVDSPPTPRTPPLHYNQTFTAPSSPATPSYRIPDRGRPIIVDERPFRNCSPNRRRRRNPSMGAVVGDRHTPHNSREHVIWDSPSTSHTSFNSRLAREEEDLARLRVRDQIRRESEIRRDLEAKLAREQLLKDLEARETARLKEEFFRKQDAEIRSRPAVPLAPMPPSLRRNVTVDQELPMMMGALAVEDKDANEEEAMKRRLRERQMPRRRFSVGPGGRRHRVAYDDGMYRWE